MSPAEWVWRAGQLARASAGRMGIARPGPTPPPRPGRSIAFVQRDVQLPPERYVAQAEAILAGRFRIFGLECELGCPPTWNRDPLTRRLAPTVHAGTLDYRDERLVGNIKYLWEPNRHLHLPALAQAYVLTRDARYADALRMHVDSWIEQCPVGYGPNWASSLELGIRLINWSIAWQLLGGWEGAPFATAQGEAFRARWLASVYQHARAIVGRLSRFSSANNHLIGETAGVWIASVTWDCWPRLQAWGARCKRILQAEALRQNAPDGGNREQAFAYQQFVLDFLLLAGLAARAADDDFSPEYWDRIESMLTFIAAMMDAAGNVPMIGDADDGYVVRLSPEPHWDNYRSLLATGAALFERDDLAYKGGRADHKTRWLLGSGVRRHRVGAARRRRAAVPASRAGRLAAARVAACMAPGQGAAQVAAQPAPRMPAVAFARSFPHAGYYVLGDAFETAEEIRMLVDAGPLGYLSLAAHGHADALSLVLNIAGREVLVDPGTYAYHTEPGWRAYFRSTRAHNTVMVDGEDQSRQAGNFMWIQHAHARCLQFDVEGEYQRFVGEHDGYRRLPDPVTHRREIVYDPLVRAFTVLDTLTCAAAHRVTRHWHFAEGLAPQLRDGVVRVRVGPYLVRLASDAPVEATVVTGGGPTQGGWISRGFGRKQPIATVAWHSRIAGTTCLITRIECQRME